MPALDGLFVLDFSHVIAGPFCTMLLGDMGASVIKVERPGKGDHIRGWSPQWEGTACAYLTFNRNKRSITLDLKQASGREVAVKLAAKADVIVESLRGRSLRKLGLGYETVQELNPRVVYCSISGYGSTGPRAELGGYDLIAQAYGGLMSVTGEPDAPPVRAGYSVVDVFAGMAAYGAVVTALVQRERTGRGSFVETSLLDAVVAQMSYHAVNHLATGRVPGPLGTASPSLVPYQLFDAADAKMIVACNNDDTFRRLCTALGREDLSADGRFATNAERLRNKPALIAILSEMFAQRSASAWGELLDAHHVPCSKIHTVADVVRDEQVAARELLPQIPHPSIPGLRAPAAPFKVAQGGTVAPTTPPALGEHTSAILRELGYSPEAIEALRASGAIG